MINGSRPLLSSLLCKVATALLLAALAAGAQQQPTAAPQQPTAAPAQPPGDQRQPAAAASSTDNPKPAAKGGSNPQSGVNPETGLSNDRLFYTLPNFLTVQATQLPPMTWEQKFKAVARGSFDPVEYPWYAVLAGISQGENSEPGYGQGAAGYAKRYGAYFADGTIENFVTGAVLPSILRQDPRYYQLGKGSFMHRTFYAASRMFVTRTDAGGEQFNASEILGGAISAGISTYSYHPRADRTLVNTLSVWGTQLGYDTLTAVIKEFWPDVKRRFKHKQQPSTLMP
jgi:hypothetical protein